MYKAIHHDGRKPLVDIASYLQRHDIVYRRPSLEPFEGLPLGDGRLGGLLSHTANGLAMQVNHTDVIDFGPDGNMQAWAWEAEERNTAPVACGTVAIQSALPCFDWVYLKEYEERLSLADGCVYGRAVTPFSRVEWKAYAANGQGALVFKVDAWQQEPAAWTITLERWPSPNFFHHYEQVVPLYDKNLAAVSARVEQNEIVIQQDLGDPRMVLNGYSQSVCNGLIHGIAVNLITERLIGFGNRRASKAHKSCLGKGFPQHFCIGLRDHGLHVFVCIFAELDFSGMF